MKEEEIVDIITALQNKGILTRYHKIFNSKAVQVKLKDGAYFNIGLMELYKGDVFIVKKLCKIITEPTLAYACLDTIRLKFRRLNLRLRMFWQRLKIKTRRESMRRVFIIYECARASARTYKGTRKTGHCIYRKTGPADRR